MDQSKEPREFISNDPVQIRNALHRRGVMIPQNISNKTILTLGSGNLRFIKRSDADELDPLLADNPSLMR